LSDWNVAPFEDRDREAWDRLVEEGGKGTLLHTRRFLDYHGERFVDRSLVFRDRGGHLRGVFPAAQSTEHPDTVVSHPGATVGGLVSDPLVTGLPFATMLQDAYAHWAGLGYRRLRYRAVPWIYHNEPRQEDLYYLWRSGATLAVRQLSECIDLRNVVKRRVRRYPKAEAISLQFGAAYLPQLWPVIEASLDARHHVRPIHSVDEIVDLSARFPDEIVTIAAVTNAGVVGGAVLFCSANVVHLQYCISSAEGMAVNSGDILVYRAIEYARERNANFFDFGISTDRAGRSLNEGLHRFKIKFGAGTIVYEQYELEL